MENKAIHIVDYGMGNLGSVVNMFKRIGQASQIVSNPALLENAEKILLPGVGSFGRAMKLIQERGFTDILHHKAKEEKIPILGICLGMQLLTESSEESPDIEGLGWVPATTRRFQFNGSMEYKIPHMGWNEVDIAGNSPLTQDFKEPSRFYFVHSYYVRVKDPSYSIMRTHYGIEFDSGIQNENIFGAQFHPEKSHKFGMKMFENFAKL